MTVSTIAMTDGVGVAEAQRIVFAGTLVQAVGIRELAYLNSRFVKAINEGVGVNDAPKGAFSIAIADAIGVALNQLINQKARVFMSDKVGLTEQLRLTVPARILETLNLTEAAVAQRAVALMDKLGLTSSLLSAARYHLSLNDLISTTSVLGRFLGMAVTDNLGVTESAIGKAYRTGAIVENLGLSDIITPRLVIRVDLKEGAGFHDSMIQRAIFRGAVVEGVQISGAFLSPSGSVTTWALNTRSAAVTEYRNYEFNSFAQLGHKYLGASDKGLYELTGATDDGANIIATIRSGMAQFSGTHLGRIKAAYVAMRGSGSFVLRIISGDGKVYNYSANAESMRSSRVNVGKGLRARYFAFELITTGQDFDLDTLEFIPLTVDRRV